MTHLVPAPYFRKKFNLGKQKTASLTICGLGTYELFVNGSRITRGLLSPYLSNPDDLLYYDCYDLIPYLNDGENVIGVLLGNGMINCVGGQIWDLQIARFRSAPKLALTFEAEDGNGNKTEFDGTSGFVCHDSPIFFDDVRVGEFYNATKELPGWCNTGFDDSDWHEAIRVEAPRGECRLCDVDPIVPRGELSAISIKPGRIGKVCTAVHKKFSDLTEDFFNSYLDEVDNTDGFIYDFGINSSGNIRLHIKNAKPGQEIILQYGELLDENGNIDNAHMIGSPFLPAKYNHRDVYICKGGDETFEPRLSYHGFRYCLAMGITKEQATEDLLTFVLMNTKLEQIGTFHCSDEVTNEIYRSAINSDLSNFHHFPTDCPHREKNGWTGDAWISSEQMLLYLTPERNYHEWLANIRKAMKDDGSLPGIIPTTGWGFEWGNGPGWDRIIVHIPYLMWIYRGDKKVLEENATAMMRYLNYISNRRDRRGLLHVGLGDWVPAGRKNVPVAPLEFADTVLTINTCSEASKVFEVLGMRPQQVFADTLKDELLASARKYLIDKCNVVAYGHCQTTQAMAIYYDIFEDCEKPRAFENLVRFIEDNDEFMDTGIFGLSTIFTVLSMYGRTDLAYKMITRPESPSYAYMVSFGGTALWEHFLREGEGAESRNHHFFGHVIAWFMQNLVGIIINPNRDNLNEVRFAPKFIDALDNAEASHKAPAGLVKAEWHRDGNAIIYTAEVPEGMEAELVLEPDCKLSDGITFLRFTGKREFKIIKNSDIDTRSYRR